MKPYISDIITSVARPMLWLALFICAMPAGLASDFTLVIDPGHGGHDSGAVGEYAQEKNINLAVGKLFGEMVKDEFDDVKVVYTRDTDVFVSLNRRAEIANKAHGDLFVSIHVNSVDYKAKNRATVAGASVYTLGLNRSASNLEVAKRENAVMTLESDYTTTYQGFDPNSAESYIIFELNQNKHMEQSVVFAKDVEDALIAQAGRRDMGVKQAGFWVLWASAMPSVLIELDFICNPQQEKYLSSEEGQQQMASAIFDAFKGYKTRHDRQRSATVTPVRHDRDKADGNSPAAVPRKPKGKKTKGDAPQLAAQPAAQPAPKPSVTESQASSNVEPTDTVAEAPTQAQPVYRVQFLIHRDKLEKGSRQFKGLYPVWHYCDKGVYKYTFGEAATWKEAEKILSKVKDTFPDAFIIKTVGNKRM